MLFVHTSHPLSSKILSFSRRKRHHPKLFEAKVKRKLDPKFSGGMNGFMYISDKTIYSEEIYSPIEGMETITNNQTMFVYFKCPATKIHVPRPPEGVNFPSQSISDLNVQKQRLWHETSISQSFGFFRRPVSNSGYGNGMSRNSGFPGSYHSDRRKQLSEQPTSVREINSKSQSTDILGKRKRKDGEGHDHRGGKNRKKNIG